MMQQKPHPHRIYPVGRDQLDPRPLVGLISIQAALESQRRKCRLEITACGALVAKSSRVLGIDASLAGARQQTDRTVLMIVDEFPASVEHARQLERGGLAR